MPSDDRAERALAALAGPREAFRSALAEAADAAEALLESRGAPAGERVDRAAMELGPFARGRLDPGAFAGLFSTEGSMDPAAADALGVAREVLREVLASGDGAFRISVAPGGDLRDAVAGALAGLGRAFAAARTIEAVVAGRAAGPGETGPFPFRRWSRTERALAPPLVVEVEGPDLEPAGLAGMLDGALKLALVVRGPAAPAPLVRLVTPGVFVAQAADPAVLDRAAATPGPAVVALVPESAALFVHDPAGGTAPAGRLSVERMPESTPRARSGSASPFQQAEELELLRALAASTRAAPADAAAPAAAAPVVPAERLAAWLLARADLDAPPPGNGAGR